MHQEIRVKVKMTKARTVVLATIVCDCNVEVCIRNKILELIESWATDIMNSYRRDETKALNDLNLHRRHVEFQSQQFEEIGFILRDSAARYGDVLHTEAEREQSQNSLYLHERRCAHLSERAKDLSTQIEINTTFIFNSIMLKESRQAVTTANDTHRLALLSFFLLLLTFVTFLFGKKFEEFGFEDLRI
ncbi:hypothetical protein DM02DRAFT_252735 [Periconia macrospinosa]|uniref:Uncharacterized protein n=1 Tax=Periconia macrospinosa TaxID=97972 RepID=A0A2V1D644_9PLEO|nr:hypothetical protein DM02DRAFT_252735 [Periconia macrospinosa]